MNYSETFNDFASRLGPTDLALYAGAAIILYVLFQDKLNPVKRLVRDLLGKLNLLKNNVTDSVSSVVVKNTTTDGSFKDLVLSWKQTRDLAVASGCNEAIKVIDQVFPHLSPNACKEEVKTS